MVIDQERQLARLGYLLFALGILFGITAVMGAIISHSKYRSVTNAAVRKHLRLQLVSFWCMALLLATAIWQWPGALASALAATALGIWLGTWTIGLLKLERQTKLTDHKSAARL